MGANSATQISARPVPQEPMVRVPFYSYPGRVLMERTQYILMNLGMSTNFGKVDLQHVSLSGFYH
jgi:hypothetical protein